MAAGHAKKRSSLKKDSSADFLSNDTSSVSNVNVASAESRQRHVLNNIHVDTPVHWVPHKNMQSKLIAMNERFL